MIKKKKKKACVLKLERPELVATGYLPININSRCLKESCKTPGHTADVLKQKLF